MSRKWRTPTGGHAPSAWAARWKNRGRRGRPAAEPADTSAPRPANETLELADEPTKQAACWRGTLTTSCVYRWHIPCPGGPGRLDDAGRACRRARCAWVGKSWPRPRSNQQALGRDPRTTRGPVAALAQGWLDVRASSRALRPSRTRSHRADARAHDPGAPAAGLVATWPARRARRRSATPSTWGLALTRCGVIGGSVFPGSNRAAIEDSGRRGRLSQRAARTAARESPTSRMRGRRPSAGARPSRERACEFAARGAVVSGRNNCDASPDDEASRTAAAFRAGRAHSSVGESQSTEVHAILGDRVRPGCATRRVPRRRVAALARRAPASRRRSWRAHLIAAP
jgi:hypothetical protein